MSEGFSYCTPARDGLEWARAAHDGGSLRGCMDTLNRWLDEQTSTPVGSVLVFVLVFLTRVALDRWMNRRASHHHRHKKGPANG